MIYVTHDQVEAMTMADKIVVLRLGKIEQVGAPLELYRNPDNRFVAGFIGSPSMNFLSGTVNGNGAIDVPALKTSVTLPVQMPASGTKVEVGIRPEHVEIVAGDTHAIELTEALGGVSYDYVRSDNGERLIVEERGDERAEAGSRVGLKFDPARAYLFDQTTEQRIR